MANESETSITVHHVAGAADLFCFYPREINPQRAFVELDLEMGDLRAGYDPSIGGNSVPMRVWNGCDVRFTLPGPLRGDMANQLLDRLAPIAERVYQGADVAWNGSNFVGTLTIEASFACEEIKAIIANEYSEPDMMVQYADADDWLYEVKEDILTKLAAGKTIDDLCDEYDGNGLAEDEPILRGLRGYLEYLQ